MQAFIKDYCNSCTVCVQIKPRRHKLYGLLKPLPIPARPWDSISMDLIEQLPASAGFTAILVVVDRLSKQGIFIPTHDTLTAVQLAGLFVFHIFSKHGVSGHVTSDCGSEFVSHFFCSLSTALGMKLHFTSGYHPEGMVKPSRSIRPLSNTSMPTATTSKTTGPSCFLWLSSPTTMRLVRQLVCLLSLLTRDTTQTSQFSLSGIWPPTALENMPLI